MRVEEIHLALAARLRSRSGEIEQATLTRIRAVSNSLEATDPEYMDGLRSAVVAALNYGIEALERGEDETVTVPTALLSQARLAARRGIELEIVVRRYLAGYSLLSDFLIEESEKDGTLSGASLKGLLGAVTARLDRLITVVGEEYARAARARPRSTEERRVERVESLLAGGSIDHTGLAYEFEGAHLGAIASGPSASAAINRLATTLDCRRLIVQRDEATVWAWFGGHRDLAADDLLCIASQQWPTDVLLSIGEPGQGAEGWRLTHRQARAALPVAHRCHKPVVRYGDVALLASMLQDDLLATSLREIYLAPLEHERDGGAALRQTLRAYFAAERNTSSAAAALGVTRQTVTNRLRVIEEKLDRPLGVWATEIEAALQMEELAPGVYTGRVGSA